MRLLLTAALALTALSAGAQSSFDPGVVLSQMGAKWTEAKPFLPPADSGRVVGKTGDLLWRAPDVQVTTIQLSVRDGVLARLVVTASEAGRREFDEILIQLRREVGAPGEDGFFSADQFRQLGAPMPVPLDFFLDPDAGLMIVRLAQDN